MAEHPTCRIGDIVIGRSRPALIAGPCVAESLDMCMTVARRLADICKNLGINFIFKASFDKANRSSPKGYRGPGLKTGLKWLTAIKRKLDLPVLSDVHDTTQVGPASKVLDCIQIPAFLCRQTDLLVAAGESGKPVNIKKGQFMAPLDMEQAVLKIHSTGNTQVLLTERGTFFGYNRLVTDMRSILQMKQFAPVVFDATHSVQEPGGLGTASGGQRQYAPMLAAAAIAVGTDALFVETHPNPAKAKSDAAVQIPLDDMKKFLDRCMDIFLVCRKHPY